ncbi:protoporphyrinogen oxidase HemJ [Legionella sp. W05-934-2]|jgi:putative membrane protein|uniref:protoporphyrinogen oxidase HemJ n=1 Tax=Legionella sp. W05-934-2 TaxID=1198649 RepID=UPI003463043D
MLYLWLKSFHIIAMVAWFAGLFYLPRLFVYHSVAEDAISLSRFKLMERRLFYGITYPAAILTTLLGIGLLMLNWRFYLASGWMHVKLTAVLLLWGYHGFCGRYLRQFHNDNNHHTQVFYRLFNEVPTILLILIVVMVTVKPF